MLSDLHVCNCRAWQECTSSPVKTQCGHVFCEECALQRNSKNGKCAVCEQHTLGIFNAADDIVKKFKLTNQQDGSSAGHRSEGADLPAAVNDGGWQAEVEDAADAGGWT